MRIAVVIVTYNRIGLLRECLDCCFDQTRHFSHIVVVDNASADGTAEYLRDLEADHPELIVLTQAENLGGAGGFCRGFAYVNGLDADWVLVIDDDAMIARDYNEILTGYGEVHPETAAVAGSVWTDGHMDLSHRRRVTSRLLFVEQPVDSDGIRPFTCDCATFCGLMLRGSIMRQLGLPKADYFIWYDDSEYCLRLMPYGGITVLPKAALNHRTTLPEQTAGLLERTNWRMYYGYRNRLDTARRHFGPVSGLGVATEYVAFLLVSVLQIAFVPSKREHARFNLHMISDALCDGWHQRLGKNPNYHR